MKYRVWVRLEEEYFDVEADSEEEAFIKASTWAMDGGSWEYDVENWERYSKDGEQNDET